MLWFHQYPVERPPHQFVSDFTAPNPQVYTASNQETQNKDFFVSKEELNRHVMQRKVSFLKITSYILNVVTIYNKNLYPDNSLL